MDSRLLEKFVRACINEEMMRVEHAVESRLALHTATTFNGKMFVLYDPMALVRSLRETFAAVAFRNIKQSDFAHVIYAQITVEAAPDDCRVPNALVIGSVGAKRGYGPLMYDIALSQGQWVMPDRLSVSDQASSVWKHYHDRRSDVKMMPLKCPEHGHTRPWLDTAYKLSSPVDVSALDTRHDGAIAAVERIYAQRPGWNFDSVDYVRPLESAAKTVWLSLNRR